MLVPGTVKEHMTQRRRHSDRKSGVLPDQSVVLSGAILRFVVCHISVQPSTPCTSLGGGSAGCAGHSEDYNRAIIVGQGIAGMILDLAHDACCDSIR